MFCENLCENSSNNKYREKNEVGMYKVSNGSIWSQFRNWDPYPQLYALVKLTFYGKTQGRAIDIIRKLIIDVFKNASLSKASISGSWIFSVSQSSEIRKLDL